MSGEAVDTLQELIRNKKTPPAIRLKASEIILDRAYGKATQTIKATSPDMSALRAAFDDAGL